MALDDRDWYRKEPSKAWKAFRGQRGDGSTGPAYSYRPSSRSSKNRRFRRRFKRSDRRLIAVVVIGLALGAAWQQRSEIDATASDWVLRFDATVNDWKTDDEPAALVPTPASPLSLPASGKVFHLGSRPGLDVPAARVTQWWVDHPRLGRVSVHVPVGTTPREALTVAFAERGYQVIR